MSEASATNLAARALPAFTFNLLAALQQPGQAENLLVSPYSIHAALSMTAGGARSATLQAMRTAL
ncbi:MAG: serpin family protein, partial [Chloroflexota bacterium]